jgi:rubrerythrin
MKHIKNYNNFEVNELLSTVPVNLDNTNEDDIDKQILRTGALAELDAINLYEQLAANAKNKNVKALMLDIAKEEKTHLGEFEALLLELDSEQEVELKNGKKEVQKLKR